MEAPSATQSPQEQAFDRGQPVGIATVLDFVTEFNQNAQIFEAVALLLIATIASMEEIQRIATIHDVRLNNLNQDLRNLKNQVDRLMGAGLYRISEANTIATAGSPVITEY